MANCDLFDDKAISARSTLRSPLLKVRAFIVSHPLATQFIVMYRVRVGNTVFSETNFDYCCPEQPTLTSCGRNDLL